MNKLPNPQDQCCENTLADMRRDAARQYDEMATKANHWSSFISHAIQAYVPKRQAVYNAINSERDYQDEQKRKPSRTDMVDLDFGSTLSAIRYNLELANKYWYTDSKPYTNTMKYLRKVAALVVQCGEKYGMEGRVPISESIDNSLTIENDCCTAKPMILDCAPQTKIEEKEIRTHPFPSNDCVKSACVESKYAVPFGDCGIGRNPDKCLKIVTPEQKAYNDILDELIKSRLDCIRKILGNNASELAVTYSDGDFKFDFVFDISNDKGQRILAICDVIKAIDSLKIK